MVLAQIESKSQQSEQEKPGIRNVPSMHATHLRESSGQDKETNIQLLFRSCNINGHYNQKQSRMYYSATAKIKDKTTKCKNYLGLKQNNRRQTETRQKKIKHTNNQQYITKLQGNKFSLHLLRHQKIRNIRNLLWFLSFTFLCIFTNMNSNTWNFLIRFHYFYKTIYNCYLTYINQDKDIQPKSL